MSTLETQYKNYLKENPESAFTFEEWLEKFNEINNLPSDISDWDVTLMDGLHNEPYVSDDFQIGPDGAYEDVEYSIPIIDEAYENYNKEIIRQREIQKEEVNRLRSQGKRVKVRLIELLSKEEFIDKCKTDSKFSEKWGLKIEERELSLSERTKYKKERGDRIARTFAAYTHQMLDNANIPTRLITITYNNETIENYE